jgi:DEAD/DEAH box helicase domain-containing protein
VRFQDFFANNGWNIVDVLKTEPRASELQGVDDLPLTPASRAFLEKNYPNGIYRHQKEALRRSFDGENVCLVTGTASGKSLVFQTAAVDLLSRAPASRVMAIYPMKALGNEQRERWQHTLAGAGLADSEADQDTLVGRIDGNVPPGFRLGVLERSRVVVFTPDILHAWLFSNLNQPAVIAFLREVRLIVVDEVHAYSGVFGSNAAFLFRRLRHLLGLLNARPQIICASATIAHPDTHLRSLFGMDFSLIGPEYDTSPRYPLDVYLAEPPWSDRFLNEVVRLLEALSGEESSRFIAFVDSRKQVELISSILNRLLRESAKAAEEAAAAEAAAAAGAAAEALAAIEQEEAAEDGTIVLPKPAKPARGRGRAAKKVEDDAPGSSPYDEPDLEGEVTGVLQGLNVLPYRAGYEDHDRRQIQERLAQGTLNGVVSTSALELGIDIPHLDVCVLIGVPGSATSLQQRIGRIGRHGPGAVIVVHGGDVHDSSVFADPQSFFRRPLAESALYLENEHIQFIHALCLARIGGEHDQVLEIAARTDARAAAAFARRAKTSWHSDVDWPENFVALCQMEREERIPRRLASLRAEGRTRPNYTFPLRDVESQFKVERRDGPNVSSMGSLSFAQLMREAYPGAIYYYATIPYRVTRVNVKSKSVTVRREKRYTTQPQRTLPAVFPRLSPGGVLTAARQDTLIHLEASLLVRESIRGVVEQRGRTESVYAYPLSREMGFFQDQPYFSRNYFTTGVVVSHPALAEEGVNLEAAAALLYEAFLLKVPFERQDIGFAADRLRVEREPFLRQGQPFLTVYDQTYGSLRLSKRLLEPGALARVLAEAVFLGRRQAASRQAAQQGGAEPGGAAPAPEKNGLEGAAVAAPSSNAPLGGATKETVFANQATLHALASMAMDAFTANRQGLAFGIESSNEQRDPARWERVVMPGSKGLMVRTNEEFQVLRILNTPVGLSYEGTPASMQGSGASVMPLLSDVAEIPGESLVGWYDLENGALEPAAQETALVRLEGSPEPPPPVDVDWLRRMLAVYFPGQQGQNPGQDPIGALRDALGAYL